MKSRLFEKIEAEQKLTLDVVLSMSMPLAIDGLPGDSPVWEKFRNAIYDEQGKLGLQEWAVICQSFSQIEYDDESFWQIIEKQFSSSINENPGDPQVLAAICFAVEGSPKISQKLKNKLSREISRAQEQINQNPQFKEVIDSFV